MEVNLYVDMFLRKLKAAVEIFNMKSSVLDEASFEEASFKSCLPHPGPSVVLALVLYVFTASSKHGLP
jgi:hypothetical protein